MAGGGGSRTSYNTLRVNSALGIGTDLSVTSGNGSLHIHQDGGNSTLRVECHGVSLQNFVALNQSRGTILVPTASQSFDIIGSLIGLGHDGSVYQHGPEIVFRCGLSGAWSGSNRESIIFLKTVKAGTTSQVNTLQLGANGRADVSIPNGPFIRSVTSGITASTTQTQGQGALTSDINAVSIVANANDTVTLPSALAGMEVTVINNGANTLKIYPASGDNLGAGVDVSTVLVAGSNIVFVSYDDTNWEVV